MNKYFGYIRALKTEGYKGSRMQRAAVMQMAKEHGFEVTRIFNDPIITVLPAGAEFTKMVRLLQAGKAQGIILYKLPRNLADWANLKRLSTLGIEVHFANESLDLKSRGGRLAADIQAVVATDYVRNLREEVKKGFYGWLKQGFYPMPAPLGYEDNGSAKPKTIDPVNGPLVKKAFELYATGRYSKTSLAQELHELGIA